MNRKLYAIGVVLALASCVPSTTNREPVLEGRSLTTLEDTPLDVNIAVSDPDGDPLTVTVGKPSHGTINGEGLTWRYTPASDFVGLDAIPVTVSDGDLTLVGAVVEISVIAANDAPVANDDAFAMLEDTQLELPFTVLLANDQDIDGPALTIGVREVFGGAATIVGEKVRFVPAADFNGMGGFTYVVSDGTLSATASVHLSIGEANDAPVAVDDSATGTEDTVLELAVADLLANDADTEHHTLEVTAVGLPMGGTVALQGTTIRFTPAANLAGPASFTYTVSDGAATASGLVSLTLNAVDDTPVASPASATIAEDQVATLTLTATDIDSTTFTFTVESAPAHGSATISEGVLTYTPALNYAGSDSFTITAHDGSSASAPVTISVTITDVIECGDGVREGSEACDDGNQSNADACLNTCAAAACGDGFVRAGVEACDDGNQLDTDACLNTCVVATCGDGVVRAGGEACDDGNPDNTDACLDTCVAASCGDGFVRAGIEQCDDANAANTDACLETCVAASCGDGFVRAGIEQCDDANAANTDACLDTCVAASCGDGFVRAGVETCDDANAVNTDACLTTCQAAACGDGFVRAGVEQCDDGNTSNTDACLSVCATAACGDGFVRAGVEQCDDANAANTDACLGSCVAASCGDGFTRAGVEQCDDGNAANTDACLNTCAAASCGDGFTQVGVEQCDDGNTANTDACLNSCAAASCGDGFTHAGVEQCDDANALDTDACLISCSSASCGDGFTYAGVEQCDDGNTVDADACSNACTPTTPPACGDHVVQASEACDDGNTADQDGCSGTCAVESCGDGLVQYGLGEVCDDGNTTNDDGCSATCQLEGGFVTVAPVQVSGALSCSLSQSNTGRKVAVDSLGNVYVAMVCGGEVYVATSTNRGVSYGAPVALGITGVSEVAIAAGPAGLAYLAASPGGNALFTRSIDRGATWATATNLATSFDVEISIEAFNDDVFVGIGGGSGVLVLHNDARGVGTFTTTDVAVSQVFFDLLYDDRRGTLMVCTDTPDFHVRVSDDRGATFAPELNPAGNAFYSDWTVGNGTIFVAGASSGSDSLILIPASNPSVSSAVLGLPYTNQASQRALAADAVGNAFVVTLLDSGGVQLDRLPYGTTTFSAPRTIVASGSYPGLSALPTSTGAVVIYADGSAVWATVQTY